MKDVRRLSLKREALTALDPAELEGVVAGHTITLNTCTIGQSNVACSLYCPWTFNTCDC